MIPDYSFGGNFQQTKNTSCSYLCDYNLPCNMYSTSSAYGCYLAATSGFPSPSTGTFSNLVRQASRIYNQLLNVAFSNVILTVPGNITYCNEACNAILGCVGYVFRSSTTCLFNAAMNATNYVVSAGDISMMLSITDLNNTLNAIRNVAETGANATSTQTNTPTPLGKHQSNLILKN